MLLKIDRTTDLRSLERIMRHPAVYPWIRDDGCSADPADFVLPDRVLETDIFFLVLGKSRDKWRNCGWVHVRPWNCQTLEYHGGLLPWCRFNAVSIGIAAFRLLWRDFPTFNKIVAPCPAGNRKANRFNLAMGMRIEGRVTSGYRLDGQAQDLNLYGVTRTQWNERFAGLTDEDK